MQRPSILLLGASGFLGRNILRAVTEEIMVGVSRNPSAQGPFDKVRWVALDHWKEELHRLAGVGPVVVIHAIALTNHQYCERHPEEAMEVNGRQVSECARFCRDLGVPFIFISTDGLFPNVTGARKPHYWSLMDRPDPISAYGRSKLFGEGALADLAWGHSIRMSFVGPSQGTGRGLIAYLARCLSRGECVEGYVDTWFTPAPVQAAASRLLGLAAEQPAGFSIRQWGSSPALTKYDYLVGIGEAAGHLAGVKAVRQADQEGKLRVPFDQSLECENPWTLEDLMALGADALRLEMRTLE